MGSEDETRRWGYFFPGRWEVQITKEGGDKFHIWIHMDTTITDKTKSNPLILHRKIKFCCVHHVNREQDQCAQALAFLCVDSSFEDAVNLCL
jgi:hypothetical protein